MPLDGIPILKTQCIGDSLQTINAAFSSLDSRTLPLLSATSPNTNIFGNNITLGQGTSLATVSGDLITTGNASVSGSLRVDGNSFLGKNCSNKTVIQGTLSLPCTGQNVIEFNGETSSFGNPSTDGAVIQYRNDLFGPGRDGLLFEKTDSVDSTVDGGIAFRNRNVSGLTDDALAIRGYGKVGVRTFHPNKELTVVGEISATNPGNIYGTFISTNGTDVSVFNLLNSPTIIPFWNTTTRTFSADLATNYVQQGGGASQGNNKVYIGWNGASSKLFLQVDSTNFSSNWPINASTATVATSALTAGSTGSSTNANFANTANTANFATNAGNATNATNANFASVAQALLVPETFTYIGPSEGYVDLNCGIRIYWGSQGFVGGVNLPYNVNFGVAFTQIYNVIIGTWTNNTANPGAQRMGQLASYNTTSFTWFSDNFDTGGSSIGIQYIAIGKYN